MVWGSVLGPTQSPLGVYKVSGVILQWSWVPWVLLREKRDQRQPLPALLKGCAPIHQWDQGDDMAFFTHFE